MWRERIRRETRLLPLPTVPELRVHLITPDCRLWHAGEEEAAAAGLPEPYWAFAWPGGQALARYLLENPAVVKGRTVLDVGAGGAIEGLAALRSGATHVIAADLDPVAGLAAQLNAEANALSGLESVTRDLVGLTTPADVVLAGDVFYDPAVAQRGLTWLRTLAREGRTVLLGDPGRGFVDLASLEMIATFRCGRDGDVTGDDLRDTGVFRLS